MIAAGAVIIGIGTADGRDDAAGLAVAQRLRDRVSLPARVIELGGEPTALLDAWHGAALAIAVDATASRRAPGSIRRIDATVAPMPRGWARCSSHALGLADAIELARTLGHLPDRLVVYGIEGADFGYGTALSPPVTGAVGEVADQIAGELARWATGSDRTP